VLENALSNNKMLKGSQALDLGIADVGFARRTSWSARWPGRPRWSRAAPRWSGLRSRAAGVAGRDRRRALVRRREGQGLGPRARTARSSLMALAETASFEEGTAAEDEALADLIFSEELRAACTPSTSCSAAPSGPPGRPTRPWPAR
jgi:hypothetical protein